MKDCFLQAAFDELVDLFNEDDCEIALEDIHYEMSEKWKAFLDAGFDPTQITKMMAKEDILGNLKTLFLARVEVGNFFTIKDVFEYYPEDFGVFIEVFIDAGGDVDTLAKKVIDEDAFKKADPADKEYYLDIFRHFNINNNLMRKIAT